MSDEKMDRLDLAIAEFEDDTLELSMEERISHLRSALMWSAFDRIKRIQKLGRKSEEAEDLNFKQIECQKQFKLIEQLYNSQIRQNKILGKAQDDGMDKGFLNKIKETKGSIGAIVRDIQKTG